MRKPIALCCSFGIAIQIKSWISWLCSATSLAIILVACQPAAPTEEIVPPYVLILTNASADSTDWIRGLKESETVKYVVSGYEDETPRSLLQRIPWLLQPGVDTIVYDLNLAGKAAADSLKVYLEQHAPATFFRIQRD